MSSSQCLKNQVAWIAGAGRGIGQAIAEQMARDGATVVLGSRTLGEVEAVAGAIRGGGGTAHAFALDVASRPSVDAFAVAAQERAGPPTILVFCAGINVRQPAESFPEEAWLRVLNVNLSGAYRFLQEGGRRMIAAGRGGSIVTITSMLSHFATPNQSAYAASKGGLLQYTRLLAVEWARYNIRVNCVSPGYIETPLNAEARKQSSFSDNILAATPMRRFGQPADIAGAVCWLASPAAAFVTGSEIAVDGGVLHSRPAIVARTE